MQKNIRVCRTQHEGQVRYFHNPVQTRNMYFFFYVHDWTVLDWIITFKLTMKKVQGCMWGTESGPEDFPPKCSKLTDDTLQLISCIPYHGTRPSFLAVVLTPPWPCSANSAFVFLENSQTETGFKRISFWWRKRTLSLPTALCWHSNQQNCDG